MKKLLATLVMALAMFSVTFAQEENQNQGNRRDPAQMVQRMTEMMTSRYGLNDTQKASLLEINKKYAGKLPMGRPRGGRPGMRGERHQGFNPDSTGTPRQRPSQEEMEKRFKEMRETREAYNAEVKNIMTDEQYQQFTEDQQRFGRQRGQGRQ